jgi:hypothetical protein
MRHSFLLIYCVSILSINPGQSQPAAPLPSSQLLLPDTELEIPFTWGGDSIGSKWAPYASLLLPVQLPGCPKQFYMQFDLGSPYSMFYSNKLSGISKKYPAAVQATDTSKKLYNISFLASNTTITAKEILIRRYDQSPINWNKKSIEIIGTIGSDIIENKVLTIDYPGKRIIISNDIPRRFATARFAEFIWLARRVMLPAEIKGKKTMLLFDTGSSTFELITDKETCLSLSIPNATGTQYSVRSWQRTMTAHLLPSEDSVRIGLQKIPLRNVAYMEGATEAQINQMKQMGMGGMTGNKLFLGSVLILDTKNQKFSLYAQ